ncbi:hypothetical protein PMZ80_004800 [Knufia obscura]|uniref:Uncharacterized protein n=2 Tax=Knufia TaxID=430999 RepID=A0AAN8F7F8_9EURO|nr:hypothetical protein PMZ80_004800 [Knufia obscura]KAK5952811.1 hypothetical protein OHC33_005930 [Knufia fluminis]
MASSTTSSESSSPFSLFGRLLSNKPSRLSGRMGSIYTGMCSELEPERPHGVAAEAWNASVEPQVQQQRYRSDSDSSAITTETDAAKSPVFNVPKWTWPERKASSGSLTPVSEPLKPSSS